MSHGTFCSECDIISCREYGTGKKICVYQRLARSYSPRTDTLCREANIAIFFFYACGFRTPAVFLQQGLDKVFRLLGYVLKALLVEFIGGGCHKRQSLSITVALEGRYSTESRT